MLSIAFSEIRPGINEQLHAGSPAGHLFYSDFRKHTMDKIRYFMLFTVLFTGMNTFAQQISKAELQVNGLTCSMCSRATETSLKSLDFIENITPDLNTNTFVITFKKDKQVNIDLIRAKVEDAGFSIGDLSATINFNNTAVDGAGLAQAGNSVFRFVNVKDRTLDGPVTARVLDKDFITPAAFKKNAAALKSDSYLSGRGKVNGRDTRIFHLSI
jgi:copper chaperone CopZ